MTIEENVSLKDLTTFKIGGKARFFCVVKEPQDILAAIDFAASEKVPYLVMGGGSNMLISDNGFPGLVIKMDLLGIEFTEKGRGGVEVAVGAGENWDGFVRLVVEKGLCGVENLSGIPGTVGAAPVQNIGAYGTELEEVVSWVEVFDPETKKFWMLSNKECRFGYRDSLFKKKEGEALIISRVGFLLKKNGKLKLHYKDLEAYFADHPNTEPTLEDVREVVLKIRSKKFPDLRVYGTAGSFFKNPIISKKELKTLQEKFPDVPYFPEARTKIKIPLGWILDHACKLKGLRDGAVGTFENQALVLVNYGGASAQDVVNFSNKIIATVKEITGLSVEWEVRKIM